MQYLPGKQINCLDYRPGNVLYNNNTSLGESIGVHLGCGDRRSFAISKPGL